MKFTPKILASGILLFTLQSAFGQTTFTGAVDNDIDNPGNWDSGLPTNDGSNDGTIPDGFPALMGSPQNKTLVFEGTSGFVGTNFGGTQANGYDVTFNGTGDADFTGNGLFLAWDGGANNDSSFTWNSTGTASTTRFFTSRFGNGTFTMNAGTINQNSAGNFDMIMGEFGAPSDPLGGTTFVMAGGTFNSAASEFEPRFGTMEMSGGTINCNNFKWDEGRGGSTFVWNFSGGTINATDVNGFNNGDRLNFISNGTGLLSVVNANYSVADAEADINAGWITLDGEAATPGDFIIEVVDIEGTNFTQISTGGGGAGDLRILSFSRSGDQFTITWTSQENATYAVTLSTDLRNWGDDLDDSVVGDPGDQTTRTFTLPPGFDNGADFFTRVEKR